MKDNTLIYVGVGVLAVMYFSRKPTTLPAGTVTVGPVTPQPFSQQTGILSSFFSKLLAPNPNTPIDTSGIKFTDITSSPRNDPGTLTVTDATGVTALSNGGYFDPNTNNLDLPQNLAIVDLSQQDRPALDAGITPGSGSDYTDMQFT